MEASILALTLTASEDDAGALDTWLRDHVAEVLQVPGVRGAVILQPEREREGPLRRIVHYHLQSAAVLDEIRAAGPHWPESGDPEGSTIPAAGMIETTALALMRSSEARLRDTCRRIMTDTGGFVDALAGNVPGMMFATLLPLPLDASGLWSKPLADPVQAGAVGCGLPALSRADQRRLARHDRAGNVMSRSRGGPVTCPRDIARPDRAG